MTETKDSYEEYLEEEFCLPEYFKNSLKKSEEDYKERMKNKEEEIKEEIKGEEPQECLMCSG
jgi:hypothetical protein